jgi:lipopolysaccharide biosynthesis protein
MSFQDFWYRVKLSKTWLSCHVLVGHLLRIGSYKRRVWAGKDPCKASNYHAVYCHYDQEGVVHDYVIDQLAQLAAAGFRITFVSNARRLTSASIAKAGEFCRQLIWRRNVGYDFGAYKDGIAAVGDLSRCDRLLLMNDSVYGPFKPLNAILDAVDFSKADFWGVTDCWDHHYHLQSYFVLFSKKALETPAFRKFWRRLPYINNKFAVIHHAEVKLTQKLTRQKLRAAVLCPYWDVAKAVLQKLDGGAHGDLPEIHKMFLDHMQGRLIKGVPLNPMHYFWETLISDFNCPFIKRELIQINPENVVYAWRWPEVIARNSNYDLHLIERHLQAN